MLDKQCVINSDNNVTNLFKSTVVVANVDLLRSIVEYWIVVYRAIFSGKAGMTCH